MARAAGETSQRRTRWGYGTVTIKKRQGHIFETREQSETMYRMVEENRTQHVVMRDQRYMIRFETCHQTVSGVVARAVV